MTVVDEIKARIDIVDLVSETVKLRRAGKSYSGFCPFHPNSRTPAFVVFPDSGTWRCFGECNEGGDIFKFVMKKEGWDFSETMKHLAERAGVELKPMTPERKAEEDLSTRLRGLLEEAVQFYRRSLHESEAGKPALAFLHKRGLEAETIDKFSLGYAPESWDAAYNHFSNKGYTADDLLQAGLAMERQSGGYYDRFRNRIMIPIRDPQGKPAGFGARVLNPDDTPKFINSPQGALFDKSGLLFGLDLARKAIREEKQAVIVEGYLDVIILHQGGFTNTVSPMGTALTEQQLHLLKPYTRRIVLALDADAAGEKATLRGLEIARQALDHSEEISFDSGGLQRSESRLQADIRVTTIPEGMDPDEVVLRDPQEWRAIVDAAKPIVTHVMDTLMAGQDLNDPQVKSDIVARVLPLIEDVSNPVKRGDFRQKLARTLHLDETLLMTLSQQGKRPSRKQTPRNTPAVKDAGAAPLLPAAARRAAALERHCLQLMIRQPDVLYKLDRSLQDRGLPRFDPKEIEDGGLNRLAEIIFNAIRQDQLDEKEYIQGNIPEPLQTTAAALQEKMPIGEPALDVIPEELFRSIVQLRLLRINERLNQIQFMLSDGGAQGEEGFQEDREMLRSINETRRRLDGALEKPLQIE
jgi:DNA primase